MAMRNHGRIGRLAALAAVMALGAEAAAMAGWTDRKEYDLVLKIRVESSPEKQLAMLKQWQEQYPKSEMRQVRRELFLAAYQALDDTPNMFATAQEMATEQPSSLVGVYWCTLLTPAMKNPKPEALAAGSKAALQLLAQLDTYFAPAQKPKSMSDADWQKQKSAAELLANRTIGYVQWKSGDNAGAQKTFRAYLEKDPKNAEVTSWLGYALAGDNQPVAAAWQLARAVSMKGDEALPEIWRNQVEELADRLYVSYHGASDGLDKLKSGAAENANPPADFKVESAEVIKQRKAEEELNRLDPELGAWLRISKRLGSADADKYFDEELKPNPLPKLRGAVIRCTPADKPREIVLGLTSATAEEVTLKLTAPMPYGAPAGTPIEFQGTADSFTKEPFNLTVLTDKVSISGWPEGPPPKNKK